MRGTSLGAYRKSAPRHPSARQRIFKAIFEAGDWGKTFDELMSELGMAHGTCSARLTELHKMGATMDSGKTRLTRHNSAATVWIVPPAVRAKAIARLAEKTE